MKPLQPGEVGEPEPVDVEAQPLRARVEAAIADLRAWRKRYPLSTETLGHARQLLDEYYLDLDLSASRLSTLAREESPDLSDFDGEARA